MGENSPKVFLSHASEDKERFVLDFAKKLRSNGVDAWLDEWEMKLGDSLIDKIFENAIRNCDAFIIILSKNSIHKKWVKAELNSAVVQKIEQNTKLIPIIIDDNIEVPLSLKSILWIKINNLNSYNDELNQILMSIFDVDLKPPLGEKAQFILNADSSSRDELVLTSLRTCVDGPGLSMVDLIVRNKSSVEVVIYKAEFLTLESKKFPLGTHPYYLPSTHQYNAIMLASDKSVSVELSQSISGKKADRFQIVLALGSEEKERYESDNPWGNASIGWINDPITNTRLTHIETKMKLRLTWNENNILESEPFDFLVYAPGHGFKARKIAGLTLENKINMLFTSKDITVVGSIVDLLGTIGGPECLTALEKLKKRDLNYLSRYYEDEIYSKIENPLYWNLPSPNEMFSMFNQQLERVIKYLINSNQ